MEDKVFSLADAFSREYRRTALYPLFKLSNVRNTKWWKIFQGIIGKFGDDEDWDAYKYVKFCFNELDGKIMPFHLSSKKLYEDYKGAIHTREKNEASIALSIKATLQEIQKWSIKNKYESLNVEAFFNDKKNKMFLFRGKYSKYFLAIIKTFQDLTKEEKENIMNNQELIAKRRAVLDNKKLKDKMKKILGDELVESTNQLP